MFEEAGGSIAKRLLQRLEEPDEAEIFPGSFQMRSVMDRRPESCVLLRSDLCRSNAAAGSVPRHGPCRQRDTPTVTCTGPCQFCLELEGSAGRCVKCGLDPGCSYDASLSPGENEFLNAHNAYRQKHCVFAMSWSTKLAAAAQSYANKCKFEHDEKRGQVGENLSASWGMPTRTPQNVVDGWYGEINDYHFDAPTCCESPKVGHFTQVVWQNTTQVGCAVASCPPPPPPNKDDYNGPWQLVVCRYSPSGNVNPGPACGQCTEGLSTQRVS